MWRKNSENVFLFKKNDYICNPIRGVAQPGSALRSGRRGRKFESSHPDIKSLTVLQSGSFLCMYFVLGVGGVIRIWRSRPGGCVR